jgi:fatty-acyl-CoA synthase
MQGLMMRQPLLVASLLTHAERHHGKQEIVSRRVEGDIHRYGYRDLAQRARRLANALKGLGIQLGERVATLAWNGYRHMELHFAVPGTGSVLHTLDPRLHVDELADIIEHADEQVVFFDLTFLPLIESVALHVNGPKVFVAMTDREHMPKAHRLSTMLLCYEDLLDIQSDAFEWPLLDENSASSLCYTCGTTGNPTGVLYSHRSTVLHTYATALPDSLNCSARDVILPAISMSQVNAWGLPYIACMVGAKLVFPGPALDGKSLYELIEAERVTLSADVPTVWQDLLRHVDEIGAYFSSMRRTVIGPDPCPAATTAKFEGRYQVDVLHAWGMTELSPVGTVCSFKPCQSSLSMQERLAVRARQGRDGYIRIADRSKDVIRSGGDCISSLDIEAVACLHPDVINAVCIAARHPKWDERPLLLIVKKPASTLSRDDLLTFLDGRVAKWRKPDAVVFVDSIPIGATGKVLKHQLRDQYRNYYLTA